MKFRVLDKGELELEKHCCDDLDVVNAARVSLHDRSTQMSARDAGLINYLLKNRHGTPFEHGYMKFRVKAPLFVFREWHRHRIGHCLPGSALITTQRNFDSAQREISELWELANVGVRDNKGRLRLLPSCMHPSLRILRDDGEFDCAEAMEIYKSGIKPIIRIEHERGVLRCTKDHKIYTPEGWKRAGDLIAGDSIGTQGRVWREEDRSIPPSLRQGIGVWTSMQRSRLIKDVDQCYLCRKQFPFDELELDHVVPVKEDLKKALDTMNLRPCCVSCHRDKTFLMEQPSRSGTGRLGVIASVILTIREDGEEETYDIEMSGDIHNFVADGVVVHNSYNEWSARYSVLEPEFYIPEKVVTQTGKPGAYTYEAIDAEIGRIFVEDLTDGYLDAYQKYQKALENGVAKQQARAILPVGIYSEMIWSCNPRSMMHFLGLRNEPNAQAEIREYASKAEEIFASLMPITHKAFIDNGRVAP